MIKRAVITVFFFLTACSAAQPELPTDLSYTDIPVPSITPWSPSTVESKTTIEIPSPCTSYLKVMMGEEIGSKSITDWTDYM